MTLGDRLQRYTATGEVDREDPEGKIAEKPASPARRWLPWGTSVEDVPGGITVNVIINQRDQTQAGTFEKSPVTELPTSIDILSELEKVERLFQDLFNQFDEEDLRQLTLVEIKKKVARLAQAVIHYDNYFSQSITLLEDGLSFIRSEDMSKDQVKAMQDVIQVLKKINLERENARQCGRILRKYKVRTVPSLD